jgi:hypothetical protein
MNQKNNKEEEDDEDWEGYETKEEYEAALHDYEFTVGVLQTYLGLSFTYLVAFFYWHLGMSCIYHPDLYLYNMYRCFLIIIFAYLEGYDQYLIFLLYYFGSLAVIFKLGNDGLWFIFFGWGAW